MWIVLYMDDIVTILSSMSAIESVKNFVSPTVALKKMGDLFHIIDVDSIKDASSVILSQVHYIIKILERFGMLGRKYVSTPMIKNAVGLAESHEPEFDKTIFQEIIGSRFFVKLETRPDIAVAVLTLAKFSSRPRTHHIVAFKRITRYFSVKKDRLRHLKCSDKPLVVCADSECNVDRVNRRSRGRIFIMLSVFSVRWASMK